MSDLFYLSETQMTRIQSYLPLSHGIPRVDDRRVLSGILHVLQSGIYWKDAPQEYGPYKTLYNRFIRWNRSGVFSHIIAELTTASEGQLVMNFISQKRPRKFFGKRERPGFSKKAADVPHGSVTKNPALHL